MSLSVGFPGPGAILINGKSPATINALSDASAEGAPAALGTEDSGTLRVGSAKQAEKAEGGDAGGEGDNHSIVVKMLLKRMQELQEQLKQQQQQLAAAQAASYPTPEAKQTAVMAIQGQVAQTNAALAEVSGNLVRELAKESGSSGKLVNTSA
ncbi:MULTISPECIES: hypothetical protein [Pseudomonas]|uniref:hypothetical protein n=1 Tax=Pseudomonas TaxID=286 RepID=UPI0003B408F8|nr:MULTISPECIES: hypothetical protein [Pseudomonas]AZC17526.1 hypothetical protein C4K40_2136 [Pseudomonas sp. CMR5c]ERO60993.1 hypothetical protein P308_11200 [Pseudomonas piscis]